MDIINNLVIFINLMILISILIKYGESGKIIMIILSKDYLLIDFNFEYLYLWDYG